MNENLELQNRIKELESVEGDPCPKCRKRGWQIESTKKHPMFGEVGVKLRTYKCTICGFTEDKLAIGDTYDSRPKLFAITSPEDATFKWVSAGVFSAPK